jgi:SAM-dependent methyltransferase
MTRISAPYVNSGNPLVLSLVPSTANRLLDVGCGAGDNARQLRARYPQINIVGLTHNSKEAALAAPHMDAVHVLDLEHDLSAAVMESWGPLFDVLLFSHVLEHLSDPVGIIRRCLTRLAVGGHVIIAVPNVVEWRTRLQLLRGNFSYADHGILDRTHMRFYTFDTAPLELIRPVEGLQLVKRRGTGSVPLGPLRKLTIGNRVWSAVDRAGVVQKPNLFAREIAMLARWTGPGDT